MSLRGEMLTAFPQLQRSVCGLFAVRKYFPTNGGFPGNTHYICDIKSINMNIELYNLLMKKYQDSATVTSYLRSKDWVAEHAKRASTKFSWLAVGTPVKHTIDGTTRISVVQSFIVNEHNLLVNVGFGNIWYHECVKPSARELKKFDGDCLVLSE